jgi:hypothetical protein
MWNILGTYFIAFVKVVAHSKFHSLEGFWPSNNWRFNYARVSLLTIMDVVDLEDSI